MAKKNISRFQQLQAISLVCLLGAFSSCAHKSDSTEEAPSLPVSEAALLSDSEKADAQNTDASIFSDLKPGQEKAEGAAAATTVSDTASGSTDPFYNAIGGESLGRVAYTLYGNRSFRKQLAEKNSSLAGEKTLTAGQQVYFDFANVKPQPTYLTKDLLDRYPAELSEKLKATNGTAGTVTVQAGETLQKVSERLYGTTRYWTELYLINHDKISSYDKVVPGMTLAMYEHGTVAAPMAQKETAPALESSVSNMLDDSKVTKPSKMDSQVAPVAQPTSADPIPDMSEMDSTPPAPVAATPTPAPAPAPAPAPVSKVTPAQPDNSFLDNFTESGNANIRRILYVLLIVGIGGLAFYFTRPTRKSKIDMLDVTAGSTAPPPARNRLGSKDPGRKTFG